VKLRQHRKRFGLTQSLERGFGGSRRSASLRRRQGFTILELLMASIAAAMLLSALYFSFDMTIQQTQTARDASGTEDLTRGVLNRLAVDIGAILGPLPPSSGGTASIQSIYTDAAATGTGTGTSTTGTSTTTSTTATASSSSSSSSANSTNTPLLGSGLNIPLEAGVIGGYQGQMTMLILFTSRVPDVFTTNGPNSLTQMYGQNTTSSTTQIPADLRRVVYWLGNSGGLYRQETQWPTGIYTWNLSDLQGGTPSEDPTCLVAEEVKNVLFEFYDPYEQTWEQTWDGTGGTQPPYSMLPGPPIAIRVTLTFEFPNPRGGSPITSTIVQVFPVVTATGQIPALTLYDPTSAGASSSGSSSSSVVGGKTTGGQTTGGKTTGGMTTNGK
jgi:prepilin-type N-terminal cleavage/methylation domain-containing protein